MTLRVDIHKNSDKYFKPEAIGLCLGIDYYMIEYPHRNNRFFQPNITSPKSSYFTDCYAALFQRYSCRNVYFSVVKHYIIAMSPANTSELNDHPVIRYLEIMFRRNFYKIVIHDVFAVVGKMIEYKNRMIVRRTDVIKHTSQLNAPFQTQMTYIR